MSNLMTQREWDRVVGWGNVPEENELTPETEVFYFDIEVDGPSIFDFSTRRYPVNTERHRFDD